MPTYRKQAPLFFSANMMYLDSKMKMVVLTIVLLLACVAWADVSYVSKYTGDLGQLMFTTLARDGSIIGATSMTLDGTGSINWAASAAYQSDNSPSPPAKLVSLDSCMAMNTMGELLVVMAAHRLHDAVPSFANTFDDPIDRSLTPRGVNLTINNVRITFKMLMQHTSTIMDIGWAGSANKAGDFKTFVENYFVVANTVILSQGVFTGKKPGAPESYLFARANIALLAYVLGQVITINNPINGVSYLSLQDYITQTMLNPMGCANTFFLNADGTAPGITSEPAFSGTFTSIPYSQSTSYASYYQGCIIDQLGGAPLLHPAYWSDYMGYTTAADLTRLVYGMFYNPTFYVTTAQMKQTIPVSSFVAGHVQQGLGLMMFSGASICAAGIAKQVMTSCPSNNATFVVGYVSNRDYVDRGIFCSNVTSASQQLCTTVSILYNQPVSKRVPTNLYAMTAAVWQDLAGTISLTSGIVTSTFRREAVELAFTFGTPAPIVYHNGATTDDQWFGVYVFLGVYFTLMGTYFGTVFIQWLLMPAALATVTETGGATQLSFGGSTGPAKQEPTILSQF